MANKRIVLMSELLKAVRRMDNLYSSWRKVRSNIISSGSEAFREEVQEIDNNPIRFLRRIQSQLLERKFKFDEQRGLIVSGRPIIVSSIKNRVAQRAVLNILQTDKKTTKRLLGEIPEVLMTPTSIGGIQKRGVSYGMDLVKTSINDGMDYYIKSDIKEFFINVPKSNVVAFVLDQTDDYEFTDFFKLALSTELENEEEIKESIYRFPLSDQGIPQGSSLSALAGNIILADFDKEMNGRGISTYRYIDDFIMLGNSQSNLNKAFQNGRRILNDLGMDAYRPDDESGKSSKGRVLSGFNFLGCFIQDQNISVGKKACQKLIDNVKSTLKYGQNNIEKNYTSTSPRRAEESLVQTISKLDRKIRGWGDAFDFTNNRIPMIRLDEKIDELVNNFVGENLRKIKTIDKKQKRRVLGIALLSDTPHRK